MIKNSNSNTWIVFPQPVAKPKLRLFCFPYAGGGAFEFRAWTPFFDSDYEIGAISLPGREARMRETPYTDLQRLSEKLAAELSPYLHEPFAFFGHSLGAFVCFETARCLRRSHQPLPIHLVVSGSRAPQVPNPEPPLYHLPHSQMIEEIDRRYNGIPREILQNTEMLELLLPSMRADFTMSDTYVYRDEEPLEVPITCYGGRDDRSTLSDHLAAWRQQTTRSFTLKMFDGDHFFIKTKRELMLADMTERIGRSMKMISELQFAGDQE